jgi:CheY-like chemotaxis protein
MELAHELISKEKPKNLHMPLVLAVEDNEDNLLLMNYALDSFGCRFISQQEGSSVLLIAQEHQPDLILLDVLMPDLSGIDIVTLLKKDPLTQHIPVIAVTALAGEEQRANLIMAGFDDYICKPYTLEDLELMIRSYLCQNLNLYKTLDFCQE